MFNQGSTATTFTNKMYTVHPDVMPQSSKK